MSSKMNRWGYEELIEGDVKALLRDMPDNLERQHIESVLLHSIEMYYPPDRQAAPSAPGSQERDFRGSSGPYMPDEYDRTAAEPAQPIVAHSKSEYKRLSTLGANVVPPAQPATGREDALEIAAEIEEMLPSFHEENGGSLRFSLSEWAKIADWLRALTPASRQGGEKAGGWVSVEDQLPDGVYDVLVSDGRFIGYNGMRTKACKLIAEVPVVEVVPITINAANHCADVVLNNRRLTNAQVDALAKSDGFKGVSEFADFFESKYGNQLTAYLIRWEPTK